MKLTCPHCGKKNINETAAACPSCGESVVGSKSARRAREYDGYAVGRRVLSLAPAWLLLIAAAFVLALLLFSWMSRRGGARGEEAFRNEATNQQSATPEAARGAASPPTPTPEAADAEGRAAPGATHGATGDAGDAAFEAGSYSVQVGAFAELSQANEQVSRLRAAGFDARVVESGGATRFRFQVRSGRYAAREEAARLASDLRARGVAGETVIIDPEVEVSPRD
ncbi:MAG: SPOR domain-containing protein [Pyrinomonadaceae bacterium]